MDLIARIDEAAEELGMDSSQTYEVGVDVALIAQQCTRDPAFGEAAALIRDVFGRWTETIHTHGHTGGSTEAEAIQSHRQIESAVRDWTAGGRTDPLAFGARWRATLERVNAPWLREEGTINTSPE